MERTGFVLEGGGMRGIYTAGVLDELMDWGLAPDGILGVSAGAIHGLRSAGAKHSLHQEILPQLAFHEPAIHAAHGRPGGPRLQLRGIALPVGPF